MASLLESLEMRWGKKVDSKKEGASLFRKWNSSQPKFYYHIQINPIA